MDAVDHFAALPSGSPFILLAVGLVGLFGLAVLVRLGMLFRQRRTTPGDLERLDELIRHGWAGWRLRASFDSTQVFLTCRHEAPPGVAIIFDTDGQALLPDELQPVDTGVPLLDAAFPVRGGSAGVQDCLQANRAALERLTATLRGWRGRLVSLAIREQRLDVVFRRGARPSSHQRLHLPELRAALPQLTWLADTILSAAWWQPPADPVSGGRDAYRGRGGIALDAAVWTLEDPLAPTARPGEPRDPISLLEVVKRLQSGTLTWLRRMRREGQDSFEPIAACAELQDLLVPSNEAPVGAEPPRPSRPARRVRWGLFQLAQRGVVALPWLVLALVSMETSRCHFDATLGEASLAWPHTSGQVTQSTVQSREMDEGGHKHKPVVVYQYAVAGRSYVSDRVRFTYHWSFEGHYPDLADAEAITSRYPVGRVVPVYYDPQAPERATLETGAVPMERIKAGVGLGLMGLLGAFIGWAGLCRLRAWHARRQAQRRLARCR